MKWQITTDFGQNGIPLAGAGMFAGKFFKPLFRRLSKWSGLAKVLYSIIRSIWLSPFIKLTLDESQSGEDFLMDDFLWHYFEKYPRIAITIQQIFFALALANDPPHSN